MNTARIMGWGAIVTSVLASIWFGVALVIAYLSKDQSNMQLMIGAIISNFTTTVSFWLGSSFGSQRKDDVISRSQPPSPGGVAQPPAAGATLSVG